MATLSLSLDDLAELQRYLSPIDDSWYDIGLQLGIHPDQLDAIRMECSDDPGRCLIEMLKKWLALAQPATRNWQHLCEVLRGEVVGCKDVAARIWKQKDLASTDSSSPSDDQLSPLSEWTTTPQNQKLLKLTDLSETEKSELIVSLESDTQSIQLTFAKLAIQTANEIREQSINYTEVAVALISYDISLKQKLDSLESYNRNDLILIASEYWSFYNYNLLELFVTTFCGKITHKLQQYTSLFEAYCKRRLCEYPSDIAEKGSKIVFLLDNKMNLEKTQDQRQLQIKASKVTGVRIDDCIFPECEYEGGSKHHETESLATKCPRLLQAEDSHTVPETEGTELRGVDTLHETSIVVTNSPQLFEWQGYGLKLHIPPQSLPSTVNSCTITIKASFSGQYQFPSNTELVSPVFWLKCEPHTKFRSPLTLEIQHCAPLENNFHLFMTRALCTQKDLPYSFKILHGGTFSENSSYGVVTLDQLSGIGVIQERSDERRYWSNVFYMGLPNNKTIHFTVTWQDDAHITTVKKEYSLREAEPGPEQSVIFNDASIALDIPRRGHVLQDKWKVFPTISPKIVKTEVDDHQLEHKTVPHCELVAKWIKREQQVEPLEHAVDILGTTEEEKYFTINIDPGLVQVHSKGKTPNDTTGGKSLAIQHLHAVKECLKDLSRDKIIEVGLALGLLYPNLTKMSTLPQDMIQAWLQRRDNVMSESGQPTVQSLMAALETSDLAGTVDVVRSKFIT